MNTIRQRLVFFNAKQTEMYAVLTKAQGRNSEGKMTFETPEQVWKRIIQHDVVNFKKYTFSHVDTNC